MAVDIVLDGQPGIDVTAASTVKERVEGLGLGADGFPP